MTPEEREKLATQVMGWTLEPTWGLYHYPDGREVFINDLGFNTPVGNLSWKPDENRAQTALLLGKIGEMGLQRRFILALGKIAPFPPANHRRETVTSLSMDGIRTESLPFVDDEQGFLQDEAFFYLTQSPETICQAILSVIEGEG